MSDTEINLVPSRPIDVPVRFIQQAWEHIQATGVRYVTLQFVEDICIGVDTRIRRMIQQQSPVSQPIGEPISEPTSDWTRQTLTDEVILGVLGQHGTLYARQIGDILSIPGSDTALRQRIHRILVHLVATKAVRTSGLKQRPKYALAKTPLAQPRMPKRTAPPRKVTRKVTRKDITEELVIEQFQTAREPLSSRQIGDVLGIARPDNLVRAKITEIVRILIQSGRVQQVSTGERVRDEFGGRLYELVPAVTDVAAAAM